MLLITGNQQTNTQKSSTVQEKHVEGAKSEQRDLSSSVTLLKMLIHSNEASTVNSRLYSETIIPAREASLVNLKSSIAQKRDLHNKNSFTEVRIHCLLWFSVNLLKTIFPQYINVNIAMKQSRGIPTTQPPDARFMSVCDKMKKGLQVNTSKSRRLALVS